MPKLLNQRGITHIFILLILFIGIVVGLVLIKNPKIFSPKAAPVLPDNPEVSFELELEKNANSPFPDDPTPSSIAPDSQFRVDIYARSDIEEANLFSAKVKYSADTVDFVSIEKREGQSFVKNWVDASSDVGMVNLVGGVPNPGIKTDSKVGAFLMGSIIFKSKSSGSIKVEVSDASAIYSNASNINILTSRKGAIASSIQQPQPTPTPTPTSQYSCSNIDVIGGIQGKNSTGDTIYTVDSEAAIKLTAQVTPSDAKIDWKEASRSQNLPAGSFEAPNSPATSYKVPKNTTSSIEGITIRADIPNPDTSKNPLASCPSVTIAVKGIFQASPAPSATNGYQRVFITSTPTNANLDGLSGADAKCQAAADTAKLGGTWKAWLSDIVTSASSRLIHHSTPYRRIDGELVANDWADLTDGNIAIPIEITEFNKKAVSTPRYNIAVWTATNTDGTGSSNNCSNWTTSTSDSSLVTGKYGFGVYANAGWTTVSGATRCDNLASLYCFEQTSTTDPVPAPSFENAVSFGNLGSISVYDQSLKSMNSISIEGWVKLKSKSERGGGRIFSKKFQVGDSGGATVPFDFAVDYNNKLILRYSFLGKLPSGLEVWSPAELTTSNNIINDNEWVHVAVSAGGSGQNGSASIYVNGTQVATQQHVGGVVGGSYASNFYIGDNTLGEMDEVRIGTKADLAGLAGGPYKTNETTILLCHFNESSGHPKCLSYARGNVDSYSSNISYVKSTVPVKTQPTPTPTVSPSPTPVKYLLGEFLETFGLTSSDAKFNSRYDYNKDGRISVVDYSGLLSKFDPKSFQLKTGYSVDELIPTYNKTSNDAGFNAKYDVNTDKVVNKLDYTVLNQDTVNGSGDGNNDGKVNFADLSVLLTDYNKTQGYRTGVDINGDGIINSFDFGLMRNLLIKNGLVKSN